MDCWYCLNNTPEAREKNAARIALEQEKEKNTAKKTENDKLMF